MGRCSTVVKSTASELNYWSSNPNFCLMSCIFGTSDSTSLCLSFPICKMGDNRLFLYEGLDALIVPGSQIHILSKIAVNVIGKETI